MSETKSRLRPKLEIILILVFFIGFMSWAVSKCNTAKREYREAALRDEMDEFAPMDSSGSGEPAMAEAGKDTTQKIAAVEEAPSLRSSTPLYVTMEGLNLRAEPTLKSEVLVKLKLFEEVEFMNEVTEFRDSISLGTEVAYEPWIKVKHRKGRIGWVYGAGVHYYKIKRQGTY